MSEFSEVFREGIKEVLENNGDPVGMDSPYCRIWKEKHPNCHGCEFELGCTKLVDLMMLLIQPLIYKPTSFEDHRKMTNRILELQERIFKSQTRKELDEIPKI